MKKVLMAAVLIPLWALMLVGVGVCAVMEALISPRKPAPDDTKEALLDGWHRGYEFDDWHNYGDCGGSAEAGCQRAKGPRS